MLFRSLESPLLTSFMMSLVRRKVQFSQIDLIVFGFSNEPRKSMTSFPTEVDQFFSINFDLYSYLSFYRHELSGLDGEFLVSQNNKREPLKRSVSAVTC